MPRQDFKRDQRLVLNTTFCDTNLYADGPKTVQGDQGIGKCLCPHLKKCEFGGFLHPESGHQCIMAFGLQVARFVIKQDHSVSEEMRELRAERPHPPKGWIYSADRKKFEIITDDRKIDQLIEHFTHVVLLDGREDEEIKELEIVKVGSTFNDVVTHATDPSTGAVSLAKIDELEGRFGTNGGRGCDVLRGPCSCGAWH